MKLVGSFFRYILIIRTNVILKCTVIVVIVAIVVYPISFIIIIIVFIVLVCISIHQVSSNLLTQGGKIPSAVPWGYTSTRTQFQYNQCRYIHHSNTTILY